MASTEPGPDDPGDMLASAYKMPTLLVLQRSRGQMTPETSWTATARSRASAGFNGAGAR